MTDTFDSARPPSRKRATPRKAAKKAVVKKAAPRKSVAKKSVAKKAAPRKLVAKRSGPPSEWQPPKPPPQWQPPLPPPPSERQASPPPPHQAPQQWQQRPPQPPWQGPAPKKSGLSPGAIVGILAGVLLLIVVVIGAALSPGDDEEPAGETTPTTGQSGQREDRSAQKEDQEVAIGQSARLSGYTATLISAQFRPKLSAFEEDGYLVADVTVANRDNKAQPYNVFDWKLQTPAGQVIDPTFTSEKQLGSGDLIQGGTVNGKVIWEIGATTKGQFKVIYKPDPFDAARGLWTIAV